MMLTMTTMMMFPLVLLVPAAGDCLPACRPLPPHHRTHFVTAVVECPIITV
jgi:hypothetical protein